MTYRRKDTHYRRARAAGYRARSAWKLAELDARFRLLHRGDLVVDVGAWPGGWVQVALERVGPEGGIVAVDVATVDAFPSPNVRIVTGDVRDPATWHAVRAALERPADVVLSDVAPKLTGIRDTDDARASELVDSTLSALPAILRPGGRLLMKLFMSAGHADTLQRLRRIFVEVRTTRAEATRRGSAELYAVGLDHRPPA
jgi:23S rRNA (uridine2552-2'-O)-methyltransferase